MLSPLTLRHAPLAPSTPAAQLRLACSARCLADGDLCCPQPPATPAVSYNKQSGAAKPGEPGNPAYPSSLRPTYTAYPHLRAICPAARIHHQTIIYYSQLAQNRILHFNTRPEYLPTSPSHADPPVAPYDSCPVHISQLQPRPITHPGFIRRRQAQAFRAAGWCIPRSSRPRNPRLRQPTRRRLLCRGRQRRAKASQRPPYAAPGPAVGHIQAAALAAQSSRERIGSTGSGILFWQQTAAVTAADRPMQS